MIRKTTYVYENKWRGPVKTYWIYTEGKAEPIEVQEQEVTAIPVVTQSEEMTPEEYKAMIELAKNAGPEDCEMCGS